MLIRVLRYRGRAPDTITEVEFTEEGGTIGRSSECTLTLPDPERHVSRVQAEVIWSDGKFVLTGRGTANPIERNGEPVAAGQSVELSDGDELHIGDYVLRTEFQRTRTTVSLEHFSDYPATGDGRLSGSTEEQARKQHSDDSELSDTAPAPMRSGSLGSRMSPVTEVTQLNISSRPATAHGQTETTARPTHAEGGREPYQVSATYPASGPSFRSWDNPEGISQTVIVGRSEQDPSIMQPHTPAEHLEQVKPVESPERIADLVNQAANAHQNDFAAIPKSRTTGFLQELNRKVLDAKSTSGERVAQASPELMQAFLCGAGLPDLSMRELDEETMLHIGVLLRSFAQGFVDLLATRATVKSEMRAEMTIISSHGNNPLKFSPDAAAVLGHLLAERTMRGYMKPAEAVQDAVDDLIAHQSGVMAGARAALQGLLQRFSPEAMETRLASRSMLDTMLPMNRKAKLWELFGEIYADVSRRAQDDFDTMFGREFVKAYEAQIKRLEEKDPR